MGFPRPTLTPGSITGGDCVGDYYYFNDFLGVIPTLSGNEGFQSSSVDVAIFLRTEVNSGSIVELSDTDPGGSILITTDTADNDSYEFQMNGAAFLPAPGKDIYVEVRMQLDTPVTSDWFFGFATIDTSFQVGVTNKFGIGSNGLDSSSANIYGLSTAASTTTTVNTGKPVVADTYITVAAWLKGTTSINYFVNGGQFGTIATNIVTGAITPSFAIQNNAGAAHAMRIDYMYFAQTR